MRAAAAKQITSAEAERVTEHRLQRFADMLEANPRAMKRLLNAFSLHQATHLLEGRSVRFDALAQWTIIELRWPELADLLTSHPHFVDGLIKAEVPPNSDTLDDLKKLFGDDEVKRVVSENPEKEIKALDEAAICEIVGLVPKA